MSIKEKRPISEMQLLDHIVIKGKRKKEARQA